VDQNPDPGVKFDANPSESGSVTIVGTNSKYFKEHFFKK
jgi:hypothetical protein